MKIIIVQGMSCLGKTSLCKEIEERLPSCKRFSVDHYKEALWDEYGFDSIEQRNELNERAKELFYRDVSEVVEVAMYDYVLLEYPFINEGWNRLLEHLSCWGLPVKTVYLRPYDLEGHKALWESRSRDRARRHAGHGASQYHDGVGTDYLLEYGDKVFSSMPTIGQTLEVVISFNPYSRSVSCESILDFIKE